MPLPLQWAREKSEKEALISALQAAGGNKAQAAKILGISRNEIYKKIKKKTASRFEAERRGRAANLKLTWDTS